MVVNGIKVPLHRRRRDHGERHPPKTVKLVSPTAVEVDGIGYAVEATGLDEPKTTKDHFSSCKVQRYDPEISPWHRQLRTLTKPRLSRKPWHVR